MPESEGSNMDTNTGETGQAGMVDRDSKSQANYDKWYDIGKSMEAAKNEGKSF